MKLKKILAVTVGATLALSTALALTACGNDAPTGPSDLGTAALELDNYVTQLDEYEASMLYNSRTTAKITQISETGETLLSGADYQNYKYFLKSSDLMVFQKGEGNDATYRIYSVNSGKVLESGLKASEIANISTQDMSGISVYGITTGDETDAQSSIIASDGTVLLAKGKYSGMDISSGSYYVGNDTERSTVYTITADKVVSATETQEIVKYFRLNVDEKTGVKTYSEVQESSLNLQPAGEYEVGSYDKNYRKIYESTEEKPVEGDIADYECYNAFNTVKFYKNGEQTGEVNYEYGSPLAFVGNYLYYYTEVSVSPDATSGYNYVEYTSSNVQKYEYHLYRYDIVANSTTELNYNVKIEAMLVQYNYATKSYDAALVRGLKMTNGVFVSSDEYSTYLTDADLKVAYDLTNKAGMPTYKLSDGKYLVYSSSKYVVADKDLEYVTDYSYNNVKSYAADNITVFQANGKYGLKDFDGKIVVSPVYDSIGNFYDGYAVATKTVNGEQQKYLLGANGKVTEMPVTEIENGKYVSDMNNGLYYVSEKVEDAYTYNITVKDYAGNTVKTFANSALNSLSLNNGILTVAQTSDSVSTVTYYVVK